MQSIYAQRASRLLIPLLILAGCSRTIPETTNRPQPPAQLGKTPPVIEPLGAAGKQAQAPESPLPVSLTADLSPVQRIVQSALPERFTEDNHPLASDYRWRFIREGEPQVRIQDGSVEYQATYRGEIESTVSRACRLDPLYPVLEGTGRLMLRERNEGLLVTMTDPRAAVNVKPESDGKCNMFDIPVQEQLAELFKQDALAQQVAQSVERAGYSIPVDLVWERLQDPMIIGSGSDQLCFYGKTRDFIVGSLKGPARQTTITGVARQAPVALYQTPCRKPKTAAPMKIRMDNAAAAQKGQPYKILLNLTVPYAAVNQQLQDQLFHQEVKLPTTFGDKMVIERAAASDAGGRTLLSIDMSGDLKGTIYYWGTPRLEWNGNAIGIPDLRMANETKLALDEVKAGYWQLADRELKERLRQASTVDLSRRLTNLKNTLSGQHKSGGLAMDLLMARQEAGQVLSTKDALVADILLEGAASATGLFPVKQREPQEAVKPVDQSPEGAVAPRSARAPEDRPIDDFSGPR